MSFSLSDLQKDFFLNSKNDINIASGSIRSGKTFIQLLRVIPFLEHEAIERVPMWIIGKTYGSVVRNLIKDFLNLTQDIGIRDHFEWRSGDGELIYKPKTIPMYVLGANDESAESKIRGMTAQAGIGDEVTLWKPSIFYQAVGRVSAGLRYKWFTCNPDSPQHYIYEDVINNPDIDCKLWQFNLLDNPTLSEEYKKQITSMYSGVFYQRFIEGKWVVAEGVIYKEFSPNDHIIDELPDMREYIIGADWGYKNPMAFLLIGIDRDGCYYVIDEFYQSGQLVDETFINLLKNKGWMNYGNLSVYADSESPADIQKLRNLTGWSIVPASKGPGSVNDGIKMVENNFKVKETGKPSIYFLRGKTPSVLKELAGYRWKERKSGEQKDEPVKENDHAMDALRYAIYSREAGRVKRVSHSPFR